MRALKEHIPEILHELQLPLETSSDLMVKEVIFISCWGNYAMKINWKECAFVWRISLSNSLPVFRYIASRPHQLSRLFVSFVGFWQFSCQIWREIKPLSYDLASAKQNANYLRFSLAYAFLSCERSKHWRRHLYPRSMKYQTWRETPRSIKSCLRVQPSNIEGLTENMSYRHQAEPHIFEIADHRF